LSAKQDFFNAIAQYHQARVAKDKGAYGEGVARFQVRNTILQIRTWDQSLNFSV